MNELSNFGEVRLYFCVLYAFRASDDKQLTDESKHCRTKKKRQAPIRGPACEISLRRGYSIAQHFKPFRFLYGLLQIGAELVHFCHVWPHHRHVRVRCLLFSVLLLGS